MTNYFHLTLYNLQSNIRLCCFGLSFDTTRRIMHYDDSLGSLITCNVTEECERTAEV